MASRVPLATVQRVLRQKADGNFLYVSQALRDIETDNYCFSRLDDLPQGLNQWYEAWFGRKFPNPKVDFVDARKVSEVILAAREPLTIALLAEMTHLEFRRILAYGARMPYSTHWLISQPYDSRIVDRSCQMRSEICFVRTRTFGTKPTDARHSTEVARNAVSTGCF